MAADVFIGVGAATLARDRNLHVTVHPFWWGRASTPFWPDSVSSTCCT
ncbi:MAG TPA: hypothetical protein VH333_10305 [Pseudonocardiaceae bacterium]|nr:hypothetical protein [Pseudonocardiaceae bacterium]